MPHKPPKPCATVGCAALVPHKQRLCAACEAKRQGAIVRDPEAKAFYNSKAWRDLRAIVLRASGGICCDCRGVFASHQLDCDHDVPIERGGARLDRSNIKVRCDSCHSRKTAREDGGFGHRIGARQGGVET